MAGRETIFEVRVSGGFAQVSAIDVETGIEVSVTTPASAARSDQHRLARRKLDKVLRENGVVVPNQPDQTTNGDTPQKVSPLSQATSKRGIIV
jgi:hypothetical protein